MRGPEEYKYQMMVCQSRGDAFRLSAAVLEALQSGVPLEQARLDSRIPHRVDYLRIENGRLWIEDNGLRRESPAQGLP